MEIWRFFGVLCFLCIISTSFGNSDPLDSHVTNIQFDASDHVPGEPFSPMDYQNAEGLMDIAPPNDDHYLDPIELAGLFEGDIILSTTKSSSLNSTASNKNAIINERQKWPGGVIPYIISAEFTQMERSVIAKAFMEYHRQTCIVFRPRVNERDYVHITKGQGCSSLVGRTGGGQPISLGEGCVYPGIAIHELMHAVGFWHEQSRWDRDDYITVFFENIQPGMEFNFQKYSWSEIQNLNTSYDTHSVMHYGSYAFSRDRHYPTIVSKTPGDKLGQRENFSKNDVLKIRRLYRCDETSVSTTPAPTPTPELGSGSCSDSHTACPYWAGRKECIKNSAWMLINCKKSCIQCNSPCADANKYCGIWSNRGECTRNPDYMKIYCAKSCKTCTGISDIDCNDKSPQCYVWASNGECFKNAKYMTKFCAKSCNSCSQMNKLEPDVEPAQP